MIRYTTTKLQAIYNSIPAAIDRKIEPLIDACEAPRIGGNKVVQVTTTQRALLIRAQRKLMSEGRYYGTQQARRHQNEYFGRGGTPSLTKSVLGFDLF